MALVDRLISYNEVYGSNNVYNEIIICWKIEFPSKTKLGKLQQQFIEMSSWHFQLIAKSTAAVTLPTLSVPG